MISEGKVNENHLEEIPPINHVDNITIPVLLIHCEHDEVVPDSQSKKMFDELQDTNKVAKYIKLEDGSHYLSDSENRMIALKFLDKFLQQHL